MEPGSCNRPTRVASGFLVLGFRRNSYGWGDNALTPPRFLAIVRRFGKNAPARVVERRRRRVGLAWRKNGLGFDFQVRFPRVQSTGRCSQPPRQVPEWLSSCRGQGRFATEPARSPPWRAMRAGTAKRSWLSSGCGNARPPSRFSSEMGTKADAKQQIEGFRALVRQVCRRGQEQPDKAVRG
jgi:hypothetical protein